MRMGTHGTALAHSLAAADMALVYAPDDLAWDANTVLARASVAWRTARTLPDLLQTALEHIRPGDRVVIMSNGGFGGFHQMLLDALADRASHGG
jgi:UDP-N-acetylmuramate: L-alanyl-gamma-D-glutamyl-meso-diaminopimelate ligase